MVQKMRMFCKIAILSHVKILHKSTRSLGRLILEMERVSTPLIEITKRARHWKLL